MQPMIYGTDKIVQENINTGSGGQDPAGDIAKGLYRIYEYADGLYFPEMEFRCGGLSNYVKNGILSEAEVEEIWKKNASMK